MEAVFSPRQSIKRAVLHALLTHHQSQEQYHGHKRNCSLASDDEAEAWGEEEEGATELVQLGAESRPKNVLILMSDTGGGHRASAEAIRDTFRLEFGDKYKVFVKDLGKEYAGWPLNNMESSYKFMVKHVQLWAIAFHSTSPRWVHCVYLAALAAFYAKQVEAGFMKYKPDIIISVHPLMQHILIWVLKWQSLQKHVVFVTVITDLNTCHPTWFHKGVNRCYCPSEEVAKRASLEGLEPSQIQVFGLPIRPSFCRAVLNKDNLRVELEMDKQLPAVLLMGGGEGMGPVKKTARALGDALFDDKSGKPIGQLVVICGRNKKLSSNLQSNNWKVPVKIRGFETQMEKWMGACDCIITKAGPGTIAEALIRGLPIILNDFIPGQEVGNIPYVVNNGAGVFSRSPKETASLIAKWFGPEKEELRKMSENALKLAQPDAVFDIVKDIHELVEERGPMAQISYSLVSSFYNRPTTSTNTPTASTNNPTTSTKPMTLTNPPMTSTKPTTPTKLTTPTNNPTTPTKLTTPTNNPTTPNKLTTPTNNPTAPTKLTTPTNNPTTPNKLMTPTNNPTTPNKPMTPTNNPTTSTSNNPTAPTNNPTTTTKPTTPTPTNNPTTTTKPTTTTNSLTTSTK